MRAKDNCHEIIRKTQRMTLNQNACFQERKTELDLGMGLYEARLIETEQSGRVRIR